MDDLLNNAPCGFLVFTDDGKIVEINATLLKMLGYDAGELAGTHVEKIFSVAGRIFYQTHFFPLLKLKSEVEEIYLSLRSKTGADIPVLINAVRHERGERFYNDCVLMPMRQRDQYEDEILQAKKLAEDATRAKDEFLSIVSHELRTPLNGILGWTQVMQGRHLDAEMTAHALDAIVRGARAQSKLIEDILDFTRIISGKLRLEVEPVDLVLIVQSALDVISPAATAKNIRLQTVFDTTAFVSGDAARLQQILWNLMSNAVKFTPEKGRVEVHVRRVERTVEISVSDTGKGISADFLPFVFERFKQSDNSTTRRFGGLGLGMAITRHLVEMHGGTIRAESAGEDQGATFTVSLPIFGIPDEQRIQEETAERQSSSFGENGENSFGENGSSPVDLLRLDNLNVLIVDDDADARDLLTTILTRQGANVTAASSVGEAVEKFRQQAPDVLVSDIEMPGEDGFSLIKQLRAFNQNRSRKIPAVALTAHARSSERLKVLSAGFHTHLAKPIETAELLAVVASLADLNR